MTSDSIEMGMAPPHPGAFIRIEALEELGLSVSAAARILGVRRATLSEGLLEDARRGLFEVVVAEALDRVSRDQADVATLYISAAWCGTASAS